MLVQKIRKQDILVNGYLVIWWEQKRFIQLHIVGEKE